MGFSGPIAFQLGGPGLDNVARLTALRLDLFGLGAEPTTLQTCHVWASFDGGEDWEPVVIAGELDERYAWGGSSRAAIPMGYRFTLLRAGGWPSKAIQFSTYKRERTATPTTGNVGPNVNVTPATGATIAGGDQLSVEVTDGDFTLQEDSIAIWFSWDGGRRRETVVRAGALDYRYLAAGATKTATGGGWRYDLKRLVRWFSALRSGQGVLEVQANDEHGLYAGEVVA